MSSFKERYSIHLWMNKHSHELEQHINKWVAVTAKGIAGSANTLKELTGRKDIQILREKGKVLFTQVPDPTQYYIG